MADVQYDIIFFFEKVTYVLHVLIVVFLYDTSLTDAVHIKESLKI